MPAPGAGPCLPRHRGATEGFKQSVEEVSCVPSGDRSEDWCWGREGGQGTRPEVTGEPLSSVSLLEAEEEGSGEEEEMSGVCLLSSVALFAPSVSSVLGRNVAVSLLRT